MVTTDHSRTHAVAWVDLSAASVADRPPHGARPELHELRLALDLQVEAMLFALGASADERAHAVPWDRWVLEDLEVVRALTAALAAEGVEPAPPSGGGGALGAGRDEVELLDVVVARYAMMDERLQEALRHTGGGERWRESALRARTRCRGRIEELHAQRGAAVQRAALALAPRPRVQVDRPWAGVPGEMLG